MYFELLLGLLLFAAIIAVFCSFCICRGNLRIVRRKPFLCPKHASAMECPLINQRLDPNMQTLIHCLSHPHLPSMEHTRLQQDHVVSVSRYWQLQEDPESPRTALNIGHTVWADTTPFTQFDFKQIRKG